MYLFILGFGRGGIEELYDHFGFNLRLRLGKRKVLPASGAPQSFAQSFAENGTAK